MKQSHVVDRASGPPTPAQLKELFAQIEAGRVTRKNLQSFLRQEVTHQTPEPLNIWLFRHGFALAASYGEAREDGNAAEEYYSLGLLKRGPDRRHPCLAIGKYRRPFLATLESKDTKVTVANSSELLLTVFGPVHLAMFQELASELKTTYGMNIQIRVEEKARKESFSSDYNW